MLMVEVDAKKWAVEESEQMLVVVGEVLVPKMGGDALLVDEQSVEESGQLVLQVVMSMRWMMVQKGHPTHFPNILPGQWQSHHPSHAPFHNSYLHFVYDLEYYLLAVCTPSCLDVI